jgi:hypothetical protein
VLLAAVEVPVAGGVDGEVDAVGVPGVCIRGGDDVVEGLPGAVESSFGGFVGADERVDLGEQSLDLSGGP